MPTPAYRVPVRVARGTKAALDAGLADLQEGEICYATDENTLYSVEAGVLTSTKSDVNLADISIVDDPTPQLGGDLEVNGYKIGSASGPVEFNSANGELVVRGGSSEGKLTLNCTANTHGVSIQSPPHSSGATYVLTLPENTGTSGQALTTDGSGVLTWETPAGGGGGAIDDLSDVDTTTVAPTDGQALVWNEADQEWQPGAGSGGGGGGASAIDDLSDVDTTTDAPSPGQSLVWNGTSWVPGDAGGYQGVEVREIPFDSMAGIDGFYVDQAAMEADGFTSVSGSSDLDDNALVVPIPSEYLSVDYLQLGNSNFAACKVNTNGAVYVSADASLTLSGLSGDPVTDAGNCELYAAWWSTDSAVRLIGFKEVSSDGTDWLVIRVDMKKPYNSSTRGCPLEAWLGLDGRVRQYWGTSISAILPLPSGIVSAGNLVAAPPALTTVGAYAVEYGSSPDLPINSIDDLSDVDTSSVAPTDGQVLVWSATDSEWAPGTFSVDVGSITSISGGTFGSGV